ncbi:MAG: hypothetical protein QXH27_00385 [Candidatus Micrarchaeia archaeon]
MEESVISPAKNEWKSFQEIKKFIEADERYAPLARLAALYVYTCAHKGVRVGMDAYIQELTLREGSISTKDALLLQNAHDVIDAYGKMCLELNEKVRQHWLTWNSGEEGTKTELGTAVAKYLMQTGSFSFADLVAHMERHYSEKKLLKYVGPIPIYKDVLMFTREAIQKKLESYLAMGMVLPANPPSQAAIERGKERRKEAAPALDDRARFVSLPYAYSIFYWQWDPTVLNLKMEDELKEMERVTQEIIGCQMGNLQAAKVLRLLFKDCESDWSRVLSNYAKIIALYYKQMNQPAPPFIQAAGEGAVIRLGSTKPPSPAQARR